VNVLVVAVFEGSAIMLLPMVNLKFSPAEIVSEAKFDIVTTCPEIEHVEDENPIKSESEQVPVVSVNSLGNVTTMLAVVPVDRAVAA